VDAGAVVVELARDFADPVTGVEERPSRGTHLGELGALGLEPEALGALQEIEETGLGEAHGTQGKPRPLTLPSPRRGEGKRSKTPHPALSREGRG